MANVLVPIAYDCDPSSLLASNPCLACLSEKELLAVLVGIIATANGDTPAEVMEASKCFTCMSKKQMLQALATILGNNLLGEGHSPQEVIDEQHCLVCATEQQLLAALLYQICNDQHCPDREQ